MKKTLVVLLAMAGGAVAVEQITVTKDTLTQSGVESAAPSWNEQKANLVLVGDETADISLTFETGTYAKTKIWGINTGTIPSSNAHSITLTLNDGAKVTAEQNMGTFTSKNTSIIIGDNALLQTDGSHFAGKNGGTHMTFAGAAEGSVASLTLGNNAALKVSSDIVVGDHISTFTLSVGSGSSITDIVDASLKFKAAGETVINYGVLPMGAESAAISMRGVCELGTTTFNAAVDMDAILAADNHTANIKLIELASSSSADRRITFETDSVVSLNLDGWASDAYLGLLTFDGSDYSDAAGNFVDIAAKNANNEIYYALVKSANGKTLSLLAHAPEPATATLSLLALAALAGRRKRC